MLPAIPVMLTVVGICGCTANQAAIRPETLPAASQTRSTGRFQFVDVQERAGVDFTHTDGGSGRHYFIEQIGSGCAFLDLNSDGVIDIFALSGASLPGYKGPKAPRRGLWRNRGDGTFEDVLTGSGLESDEYGFGVCAGDFDNDGLVDLYVTCLGRNHLYKNLGNFKFRDVTAQAGVAGLGEISTSACFVDIDNDGWLDLYVCHYVKWRMQDDRWCNKAQGKKSYCGPEVYFSHRDELFHNNGNGTFTEVAAPVGLVNPKSKSLGVVASDLNGDGWMDIYVACDLEPNLLFLNDGKGRFAECGVHRGVAYGMDGAAEAGMGVCAVDYDNDGAMDLFVTNYSYEMNALYHNDGKATFTYASQTTNLGPPSLIPLAFGTRWEDFDNDGWLDVVVGNGHVLDDCHEQNQALEYEQRLDLYSNRSGRSFNRESDIAGPAFQSKFVARGLATGDFDNDGRVDLLVNNNHGPLRLIHNETQSDGGWIGIQLVGTKCNRSAIGARIQVTAGADTQSQEVASGSSFESQSDLRLHFGLGSQRQPVDVKIRWPGSGNRPGQTEEWRGLLPGKYHTLTQGASGAKGGSQSE